MLPGETIYAPRGVPPMTVVVISGGEEKVHEGLDPQWNVSVHVGKAFPGRGFIDKCRVGNTISSVPGQPDDAQFVIRKLEKARGLTKLLVLTPKGEPEPKIIEEAPTKFQWPRPKPMSVWERLRKPAL